MQGMEAKIQAHKDVSRLGRAFGDTQWMARWLGGLGGLALGLVWELWDVSNRLVDWTWGDTSINRPMDNRSDPPTYPPTATHPHKHNTTEPQGAQAEAGHRDDVQKGGRLRVQETVIGVVGGERVNGVMVCAKVKTTRKQETAAFWKTHAIAYSLAPWVAHNYSDWCLLLWHTSQCNQVWYSVAE